MSSAKLKIDMAHGTIEVEGTEDFVLAVYSDFKERLTHMRAHVPAQPPHLQATPVKQKAATSLAAKKGEGSQGKSKKKTNNQPPSLVKDLDLSGAGKFERLKDFYNLYEAKSNFERNLLFIYYLANKLGITGITPNHVYTCYRDVSAKVPIALRQSLFDTAHTKGWLDTSSIEDIKLSTSGLNYLEHDFPKKSSQ